jgi:hypothetical protein
VVGLECLWGGVWGEAESFNSCAYRALVYVGAFGEVSMANVSSHGLVAIKWLKVRGKLSSDEAISCAMLVLLDLFSHDLYGSLLRHMFDRRTGLQSTQSPS